MYAANDAMSAIWMNVQLIMNLSSVYQRHAKPKVNTAVHAWAAKALRASLAAEIVLDNVLELVLRTITMQLGECSGSIWLYNDSHNTFTCHMTCDIEGMKGPLTSHLDGLLKTNNQYHFLELVQTLQTDRVIIHNEQNFTEKSFYEPYKEWLADQNIKTLLYFPLFGRDTFFGTIVVWHTWQGPLQPEELALARLLAHQATLAFQLTYMSEQNRHMAKREERNRIACEIHDTLAQGFVGILRQLEVVEMAMSADVEKSQQSIKTAKELAQTSLTEARQSIRALRPHSLQEGNLQTALLCMAKRLYAENSIWCEFVSINLPESLPTDVERELLWIAQEAIRNAIQHAEAAKILVSLIGDDSHIVLTIRDNGCGVNGTENNKTTGGFGLKAIQARTASIHGQLRLHSTPGGGTELVVRVPV